jgi:phosphate-selective porin OprO and OprP
MKRPGRPATMKLLSAAVLALAACGFAARADAKTLEEILRDRGVITEEDYKEAVKKNDLAYYRPGRGITVESRDGKHTAHVGGRLQVRYTFTDVDDPGVENRSEFNIQRMRVWLRGNVFTKDLYYTWQHDFGGSGGATLKDALVGYRFADPFSLQVGQFKAPTSRQQLISSGSQMFVDRSLADGFFNLGRDRGVMASGAFADARVRYMAGIFNGKGENRGNSENNHLYALRLDVNPLGKIPLDEVAFSKTGPLVNVGASYGLQTLSAADQNNVNSGLLTRAVNLNALTLAAGQDVDVRSATANVHLMWMGLSAAGEYYFADIDPDGVSGWDADGYYVQAGYEVVPGTVNLALRYSAVKSTDGDAPAAVRFDRNEWQVGANYYYSKHAAKISADFTRHKDDLRADRDDNVFRLQAQVIF